MNEHVQSRSLRIIVLVASCALILAALQWALLAQQRAQAAAGCSEVVTVPSGECQALVDLYSASNGVQWSQQAGWLAFSAAAPCDWHGVTCTGGRVTGLALARNQLSGTLPSSLGELTALTRLRLENNALSGQVPRSLCRLSSQLQDASYAYNALFTRRPTVRECLNQQQAGWQSTQTVAVTDLRPTAFYTNALRLSWTPIAYTGDDGGYEVLVATDPNGHYRRHGQVADKRSSTYLVDGLQPGRAYHFLVRSFTPAHGDQPNALRSQPAALTAVTRAEVDNLLVMAYFPADNDLAPYIEQVVERFRRGTLLNPNAQVALLVDGGGDGDTRLLEMAGGVISVSDAVQEHWGADELDTADPQVLAWFLQHARARFPATRTVVTLMGHGMALAPEVDWPGTPAQPATTSAAGGEIPPLPKEHEATPSDVTNNSYLSAIDVGQALLAATNNGAAPFDLLFFDQCFQGSLDMLYEVYRTAAAIVASPNYAWLTAAYDRYMARWAPGDPPDVMAQAVIDVYQGSLDDQHPNSIFWVESSLVPQLGGAVSGLGDALGRALRNGEVSKIAAGVIPSRYADTTQCAEQTLHLGPPDELIGVEGFATALQSSFGAGDAYGVHAAASAVLALSTQIERRTRDGNPYLAPDEFWDYDDVVTLLAPLPRNSPPAVAWRASIYRDDTPLTAGWSIDPARTVTVTASLAYVREGRWDEFLAAWYTELTPTVGAWCNYIPPERVASGDTDVLTLTAALSGTTAVEMAWTPADEAALLDYWLYIHRPNRVSWSLQSTVAPEVTTAQLVDLAPGHYRFAVMARNVDNQFVARSAAVVVEVPAVEAPGLFLPLIRR